MAAGSIWCNCRLQCNQQAILSGDGSLRIGQIRGRSHGFPKVFCAASWPLRAAGVLGRSAGFSGGLPAWHDPLCLPHGRRRFHGDLLRGWYGAAPDVSCDTDLLLAVLCAVPVFTTMVRRFRDCGLPVWLAGLFPGVIALSMAAGFEERVTALILLLLFLAAGFWPGQGAEEESL